MFDFGEDPSDAEVLRKVADLLNKQFPHAGHWRELVAERLESMATNFDRGKLVYVGAGFNARTEQEMAEHDAYRNKLQAQEASTTTVDVPSISGWTPPIMYDIQADKFRLVTQMDVEIFSSLGREWAMLFESIQSHQQNHRANVLNIMKQGGLLPDPEPEVNHEHANQ